MEESRREDNDGVLIRDCYGPEYIQPLAIMNSKVALTCIEIISHLFPTIKPFQDTLTTRQRNIFKVAVYYEPKDFVITKVCNFKYKISLKTHDVHFR